MRNLAIAIGYRPLSPWRDIHELGQHRTWIPEFLSAGAQVITVTSESENTFLSSYDNFRERCRHSPRVAPWMGRADKFWMKMLSNEIPSWKFDKDLFNLKTDLSPTLFMMYQRAFAMWDWFLKETQSEYLLATMTGIYLNIKQLGRLLDTLEKIEGNFVAGMEIKTKNLSFISGAATIYPRRTVEKVLAARHLQPKHMMEDVGRSELFRSLGVRFYGVPYLDLLTSEDVSAFSSQLKNYTMFKIKSENRPKSDIEIMLELHSLLG